MKTVSRLQRVALAGTIAISGLLGASTFVAAQDGPEFEPDYYESQLTGYEIEIEGDDFVIDDVVYQEYDDGENEQIYIESEYSSTQVSFFDDSDAPEDTIELWISDLSEGMDSLEIVESGEDDDVVWYYAEGEFDEAVFVYYIQVTEDVEGNVDMLESVLTLEGELVDSIDAAQQDIAVDGEEFMDDVDLDDLEEFLDGGTFRGSGDDDDDDSTRPGDDDTDRDRDEDEDDSTSRDRERLPADEDDEDDADDTGDDSDDTNGTDDSSDDEDDSGT